MSHDLPLAGLSLASLARSSVLQSVQGLHACKWYNPKIQNATQANCRAKYIDWMLNKQQKALPERWGIMIRVQGQGSESDGAEQ
jgi:hypothetical protein